MYIVPLKAILKAALKKPKSFISILKLLIPLLDFKLI